MATHTIAAILLLVLTVAPAAAQQGTNDATAVTCLGTSVPCWVLWIIAANVILLLAVAARTIVLVGRIRRGPDLDARPELPPDLRDEPSPPSVRTFPARHSPWPDEAHDDTGSRSRRRPRSSEQVAWGHHRLWFDDGRYFFSDAEPEEDWLPCFTVPKGHCIVAGQDGVPRLRRDAPRRRD